MSARMVDDALDTPTLIANRSASSHATLRLRASQLPATPFLSNAGGTSKSTAAAA